MNASRAFNDDEASEASPVMVPLPTAANQSHSAAKRRASEVAPASAVGASVEKDKVPGKQTKLDRYLATAGSMGPPAPGSARRDRTTSTPVDIDVRWMLCTMATGVRKFCFYCFYCVLCIHRVQRSVIDMTGESGNKKRRTTIEGATPAAAVGPTPSMTSVMAPHGAPTLLPLTTNSQLFSQDEYDDPFALVAAPRPHRAAAAAAAAAMPRSAPLTALATVAVSGVSLADDESQVFEKSPMPRRK